MIGKQALDEVDKLTPHESIIQLEGCTVSFDGFKAMDNLTFYIEVGELRVVIGPNGAGKTTLIDVISGKVKPSHGRVIFAHDIDLSQLRDYEISNLGIGRKFQTPTTFEKHTVRENLELSLKGKRSVWTTLFSKLDARDREKIDATLELVGTGEMPAAVAAVPRTFAETWDAVLAALPKDWSDLYAEVELYSSDYLDRAALLLAPVNPARDGSRLAFRFRAARRYGYGVSPEMARRCFERLDAEGTRGTVLVLRALSDTRPVQTQGPVWYIGGKSV